MDYSKLTDRLTETMAGVLHYQDQMHELDMNSVTAKQVTDMTEGGRARYMTDFIFKARVDSVVAIVLHAVRECE